jgi:murein DD-endopeptidase MepM/ murein hydrolase activator NlpD
MTPLPPWQPTFTAISPTPSQTPILAGPCSPLRLHTIAELPAIISDGYHPPPPRSDDRHPAVDFAYYSQKGKPTIEGEPVQAVFAGWVAAALVDTFPYGNVVILETDPAGLTPELIRRIGMQPGESLYLLYAHMQAAPRIDPGQRIDACQLLGAAGKTGNAAVAHLHLEARLGPAGMSFPELASYTRAATDEARRLYALWAVSGTFHHFDPMRLFFGKE